MKNKSYNIAAIKNPYVRRGLMLVLFPLFAIVLLLIAVFGGISAAVVALCDTLGEYGIGLWKFCTRNVYIAWVGQDVWDAKEYADRVARMQSRRQA